MNKCLTSAYVGYIIFYNYLLRYNKIYVSGMLMIRSMTGFGRATAESEGYFITGACTLCRACENACPQNCIDFTSVSAKIQQAHCLHCGNCFEICPARAIEKRGL